MQLSQLVDHASRLILDASLRIITTMVPCGYVVRDIGHELFTDEACFSQRYIFHRAT